MSLESQRSISDWADTTFGSVLDPFKAIRRSAEEMQEFLQLYNQVKMEDERAPIDYLKILNEAADVVITLYRLAQVFQMDLSIAVDLKMKINRQRQWQLDGTGHGQHLPAPSSLPDNQQGLPVNSFNSGWGIIRAGDWASRYGQRVRVLKVLNNGQADTSHGLVDWKDLRPYLTLDEDSK